MSRARWGLSASAAGAAVALAGCSGMCMFVPCDPSTTVEVANQCGFDIEANVVWDGDPPGEYGLEVVPAGASANLEEMAFGVDVWIRSPEDETWQVVVPWGAVREGNLNEDGNYIVDVTGDRCPK